MIRIIIIVVIGILIQSCTRKDSNIEFDSMDENGWISIRTAPQPNGFYLINEKIYGYEFDLPDTVDAKEFVSKYAKFNNKPINDADSKTFKVCINKDNERYAKESRNVYYADGGRYVEGEDFSIIEYDDVLIIDGADPETFNYIGNGYAADIKNVYYKGHKIADADVNTFKSVFNGFAIDKEYVYYRADIIKGADPRTFRYLDNGYSVDSDNVYFHKRKVVGADPLTFKYLYGGYAIDKSNMFVWDKKIRWNDSIIDLYKNKCIQLK